MADAGIRLTVEGEKEFRAALAECDTAVKNNQKALKLLTEEYKLNDAGMKDATSGFGSMAEAQQILATKGKVLADSIEVQTEKVGLLDARVQEASETYGEHDKRTEALRGQLYEASVALTKLTAEQEKNRQAMADAENSTAQYDEAVKALEAQLAANQAELKAMGGGLDALKKDYAETEKESGELEKATGKLGAGYVSLGKVFGDTGKDAEDLQKKEELLRKQEENLQKQNQNLADQNAKLTDSISKQKDLIDALAKAQETAAKRYGEGSTQAEAYRKKIAEATGQLDAMERELRENEQAIRDNNKAVEDGGEAPNGMLDGLKAIEEMTGIKIPAGIEKMIGGFDAGALAVGGAVGGIIKLLIDVSQKMEEIWKESVEWADDISTTSAELGTSTDHLQELDHVALELGTDISNFTTALSRIAPEAGKALLANRGLVEELQAERDAADEALSALSEKRDAQEEATDAAKDYYETTKEAYTQTLSRWEEVSKQLRAVSSDGEKIKEALKPWQEAMEKADDEKKSALETYEKELEKLEELKTEYYEQEDALSGIVKMQDEAREAAESGIVTWDQFGVALTDTEGKARDTLDVLLDVLEYFEKEYPDALTRSAAMEETFGRKTSVAMNGIFEAGIENVRRLMQEARDQNNVRSEEEIAALDKSGKAYDRYKEKQESINKEYAAMRAAQDNVFLDLFSYLGQAGEKFDEFIAKITMGADYKPWDPSQGSSLHDVIKDAMKRNAYGYASGTMYAPGGYALVGERGPEIVDLPRGSKVYPNGEIPAGLAGGTTVNESNVYNISIDASSVEEFDDIVRIARGARVGMRRG